jgi:hypothetical protein
MSLSSKREALARIHGRYGRAGRPHKSRILSEFCATCGYHPKSALRLLNRPLRSTPPKRSGPKVIYEPAEVLPVLKTVWLASDQLCSKLLKAALPEWLEHYQRRGAPLGEAFKKKPTYPARVGIPEPCLCFALSQKCPFCGQALLRRHPVDKRRKGFAWGWLKRTDSGQAVGADGREVVVQRGSQREKLPHDAGEHLRPISHGQFVMQSLEVSVNGVLRNAESRGDGGLRFVIEHAPHELQLPPGELEAAGNEFPGMFREHGRAQWVGRQSVADRDPTHEPMVDTAIHDCPLSVDRRFIRRCWFTTVPERPLL